MENSLHNETGSIFANPFSYFFASVKTTSVKIGKDSDLELLKAMIGSDECSFPVISVSPTYFEEQNRRYRATGEFTWEHVLIVLGANDRSSFHGARAFLGSRYLGKARLRP